MSEYNKTHLPLDLAEDRMIVHRDYIAHCLRWSHVMRHAKTGQSVLDLGAADFPLCMAYYTNKYSPEVFVGVEIRDAMLFKAQQRLAKAPFPIQYIKADLCTEFDRIPRLPYDIITSFEFVEHIPGEQVEPFLRNVAGLMNDNTLFFLSTPCYDGKNMAENHIKEWYYEELKEVLVKYFSVEASFGTFINQAEVKGSGDQKVIEVFNRLRGYYDSNYLATIFAPLFPEKARNALWRLRKKTQEK